MGLRQTISEWIRIAKDTFDFGPEFPAALTARRVRVAEELTELRRLLEETQKTAREKDELIAKLQAAATIEGNMVVDGAAYFVRKDHLLEGPFCTACFQQSHETNRIVPTPRPEGAEEDSSDWVQCTQCQMPFRSERISEYLNPRPAVPAQPAAPPEEDEEAKPVTAARKPRRTSRRKKNEQASKPQTKVSPEADLS
jgi:hypothetical protein